MNANVIILTQNKIQKGAVFTALFFYFNEKISDE
jgi:hypothetical protein